MIDQLLEGNRLFVENEFNRNLNYYTNIAHAQHPQVLWIGCSDSRVPEDEITGSKPGTIFVHRNVANIVAFNDVNIAAIVEYAMAHLKIPDIIVCGHYNCGGIQALDEGVEENYIADWLLISGGAKEKVDRIAREQSLTRSQRLNLLSEENVRLQIKHLSNLSLIKNMRQKGDLPRIHGWIYAMESGQLKVLVDGRVPNRGGES
jgi:carbonic anhydrase